MRVIVPRDDGQATLRLQHVSSRRVVDNDCIFHVPTHLSHILYENSIDKCAMLTEESDGRVALWVHHIHQWVRILSRNNENKNQKIKIGKNSKAYLGETSCENANFKILGHLFQEIFGSGTFHHVNI